MRRLVILLFFLASLALHAEDWGPLQFLIGDWSGEGGGQPGQASAGSFSFTPELQGTILVRRSFAEYPPANGRPAFRHDDLIVVYPKNGGWDAARQASPLSNKCLQKWRLSPNG
jgi:hypothetical protein